MSMYVTLTFQNSFLSCVGQKVGGNENNRVSSSRSKKADRRSIKKKPENQYDHEILDRVTSIKCS